MTQKDIEQAISYLDKCCPHIHPEVEPYRHQLEHLMEFALYGQGEPSMEPTDSVECSYDAWKHQVVLHQPEDPD